MSLQDMTVAQLEALEVHLERQLANDRLAVYEPYPQQLEWHNAGKTHREKALISGNQVGKSTCLAFELAIHATGRYPEYWQGRRFDKPIRMWVASLTAETTRDICQRLLIGNPQDRSEWGTGTIPKDCLPDFDQTQGNNRWSVRTGVADALGSVQVKHTSGGWSTIIFKSYDQRREKFQGESLQIFALDEEPSLEIYTECLARISATSGLLMAVYTPLLGFTDVVRRYMEEESPDRFYCQMTIDQAEHKSEEDRQKIIDGYPAHEKEARLKGIPSLGSGRIYTTPEEEFLIDPIEIPKHWPRLIGLDLGLDENFAAVLVAWDRDTDTAYLIDTYKGSKGDVLSIHASRIKKWGDWIPVVWPHDAGMKDRTTGKSFKQLLKAEGLRMTKEHAQLSDGGISVEAGIMTVQQRLREGRLKVARHLEDFLKEYRTYHRDQIGRIVKQRDHIQDATRYALVSLRMGRVKAIVRKLDYSRMPVVY